MGRDGTERPTGFTPPFTSRRHAAHLDRHRPCHLGKVGCFCYCSDFSYYEKLCPGMLCFFSQDWVGPLASPMCSLAC